jgi:PAS domain-containing protein
LGKKSLKDTLVSQETRFHEGQDQFWQSVVDTMLDGLLVVDVEGVILAGNRAMEQITPGATGPSSR